MGKPDASPVCSFSFDVSPLPLLRFPCSPKHRIGSISRKKLDS